MHNFKYMDYDKEFSNKKELVDYAENRGISTEGTRAEITERLVAQDEINAAAEEDEKREAQAVSESDTPADTEQEEQSAMDEEGSTEAPVSEGFGNTEGVMTSDAVKVKRDQEAEEAAAEDVEDAEEIDGKVLVKMSKRASSHSIGDYRFTRVHPFCLVDKETADRLTNDLTGFRLASAREAEEYYAN